MMRGCRQVWPAGARSRRAAGLGTVASFAALPLLRLGCPPAPLHRAAPQGALTKELQVLTKCHGDNANCVLRHQIAVLKAHLREYKAQASAALEQSMRSAEAEDAARRARPARTSTLKRVPCPPVPRMFPVPVPVCLWYGVVPLVPSVPQWLERWNANVTRSFSFLRAALPCTRRESLSLFCTLCVLSYPGRAGGVL